MIAQAKQLLIRLHVALRMNPYHRPIWADKRHGGILYTHLRQCHKKRKKKYGSKDKRGQIRNRISIDERPAIVAEKTRIGDWEIDTVIGQNLSGRFGYDSGSGVQVHPDYKGGQ